LLELFKPCLGRFSPANTWSASVKNTTSAPHDESIFAASRSEDEVVVEVKKIEEEEEALL